VTPGSTVSQAPATVAQSPPYGESGRGLVYASWGSRFVAWLIDVLIVGAIAEILQLPALRILDIPFMSIGSRDVILFLYWTLSEGIYGKSIGKMAMRVRVVKLDGSRISLAEAAIESVGKAFILPLDCIIGWIAEESKSKKQRLFSMIAKTVVI
jgi:uncharacterized RDD family membrane protein YckC